MHVICFRMPFKTNITGEELEIVQRYTGYFADFVKHGKPTHGDPQRTYGQEWTPYETGMGQFMAIDSKERSGMSREVPFPVERMEFWRKMHGYEDFLDDFKAISTSQHHDEM